MPWAHSPRRSFSIVRVLVEYAWHLVHILHQRLGFGKLSSSTLVRVADALLRYTLAWRNLRQEFGHRVSAPIGFNVSKEHQSRRGAFISVEQILQFGKLLFPTIRFQTYARSVPVVQRCQNLCTTAEQPLCMPGLSRVCRVCRFTL